MTDTRESAVDFDAPIERRHTASVKWDRYRDRDILPLWVADMDFASADVIVRRAKSGFKLAID